MLTFSNKNCEKHLQFSVFFKNSIIIYVNFCVIQISQAIDVN
jgi:hypothetical protein